MLNTGKTAIFATLILALIAAKVLPILHTSFAGHYLDIDRLIALTALLLFFHTKVESIAKKPILIMGAYYLVLVAINLHFEITSTAKLTILFMLTAFVEEILLRGVLFELLLKKFREKTVLIGTSILFTAVHPAAWSNLSYAAAVFLTGILLGGIYLVLRRGSKQIALAHVTGIHGAIILLGMALAFI